MPSSRDGIDPESFPKIVRKELARYASVVFHAGEVTTAVRESDGCFRVSIRKRRAVRCRKLLIATGVFDELPRIQGIEPLFGTTVFQCLHRDGWEMRDKPIAVYGKHQRGFEMARAMTAWCEDIALCTDGPSRLSLEARTHLRRNGVQLFEHRIDRLEGKGGALKAVVFRDGPSLPRSALFFDTPCSGQSRLAESLGCRFSNHGIKCGQYEATSVPGVFVAGNIIKDVQLVIVAAAEGTRAAFGINRALTRENFAKRDQRPGVVAGNIIKDVQLVIVAAAEGTRAAFGINRALTRENFAKRATGCGAFNTLRWRTTPCSGVVGRRLHPGRWTSLEVVIAHGVFTGPLCRGRARHCQCMPRSDSRLQRARR